MKDIRRLNLSAVAEIHCLQRLRDKYNNFFSLPAPINRADTTEEHCFFFLLHRRPPISAIIACTWACQFMWFYYLRYNIDYTADSCSYIQIHNAFLLPNRALRRFCYLDQKISYLWRSKFARTTYAKIKKTHLRILCSLDFFRCSIIGEDNFSFSIFLFFFFVENQKRDAPSHRIVDDDFYLYLFLTNDKFSNLYTERRV